MIAVAALAAGAGIVLSVMGIWAYTGHWSTWFTRSKARGSIDYTGPASLFIGAALVLASMVIASVLAGAPKPVSYALIVPVAAAAFTGMAISRRPPSFLIPAWTQSVHHAQQRTKENHGKPQGPQPH